LDSEYSLVPFFQLRFIAVGESITSINRPIRGYW